MATQETTVHTRVTRVAGADLAAHRAVQTESGVLTVAYGSANSPIEGVTQHAYTDGQAVSLVQSGDFIELEAGGAVAVGAMVATDTSGRGVTAAPGPGIFGIGVAQTAAAASGDVFRLKLFPMGMNYNLA